MVHVKEGAACPELGIIDIQDWIRLAIGNNILVHLIRDRASKFTVFATSMADKL